MYSYGSDDEDYDYDTFSMGSDDMEKFGCSNDDEVDRYETYEMSSGDELSVGDGEDCVDDFDIAEHNEGPIISYEDFQASRTKDDEDEPFFDESNQDEMRRDNDRLYDDYKDHLYSTHVRADNGEWLQRLSLDELDAFGLDDKCDCEGCYQMMNNLLFLMNNSPQLDYFDLDDNYASDFDNDGWYILVSTSSSVASLLCSKVLTVLV